MNCKNCNTVLTDGVLICPQCGFNNEDQPLNQVSENALPEELEINKENLTQNIADISSADNISTYDETNTEVKEKIESTIKDSVDISIPTVVAPDENEIIPDGTPVLESEAVTLGSISNEDLKKNKFVIKFKSNKKISLLVTFLICLASLGIGCYAGASLFSRNVCTSPRTTIQNNQMVISDGVNNITQVGNFTITIPKDFKYDKKNDGIFIYNNNASYRIYLRGIKGNYDDLSASKTSLKASITQNGMTINDIKEINKNNRVYLILEGTFELKNHVVAYTKFNDDYLIYIDIVDISNNYNHDTALDAVNDIISNLKYNEQISEIEKINFYDINDLNEKIIDEYKKRIISTN